MGRPQEQVVIHVDPPDVTVTPPPQDNTLLWVSGVAVPILVAVVGWWLQARWRRRRKK